MMADAERNRLAAKMLKAEMMGDLDTMQQLKKQLDTLTPAPSKDTRQITTQVPNTPRTSKTSKQQNTVRQSTNHIVYRPTIHEPSSSNYKTSISEVIRPLNQYRRDNDSPFQNNRVKKFIESAGSLSQMFVSEKNSSTSDEAKMFMKTSAKFARDDMETKYFSQEMDNSEMIMNRAKKHKPDSNNISNSQFESHDQDEIELCERCDERQPKHLVIDRLRGNYMALVDSKPFLSSQSNVIIRNTDHGCSSFVAASDELQAEAESIINVLRASWKAKGYRCIVMETYFKNLKRGARREFVSFGPHYQLNCLPIKEKHYERARMCFKQALMDCEKEWSMNRKLIQTIDGRRIQRLLPKGLSYFWVCFDSLTNAFGHVIESEREFPRLFGLEVLAGLLDKDFNPMKLNEREEYRDQFERARDFKLMYAQYQQLDNL